MKSITGNTRVNPHSVIWSKTLKYVQGRDCKLEDVSFIIAFNKCKLEILNHFKQNKKYQNILLKTYDGFRDYILEKFVLPLENNQDQENINHCSVYRKLIDNRLFYEELKRLLNIKRGRWFAIKNTKNNKMASKYIYSTSKTDSNYNFYNIMEFKDSKQLISGIDEKCAVRRRVLSPNPQIKSKYRLILTQKQEYVQNNQRNLKAEIKKAKDNIEILSDVTKHSSTKSKLNPSVEFERTKTYQSLIAASIKRSEAKQKIVEKLSNIDEISPTYLQRRDAICIQIDDSKPKMKRLFSKDIFLNIENCNNSQSKTECNTTSKIEASVPLSSSNNAQIFFPDSKIFIKKISCSPKNENVDPKPSNLSAKKYWAYKLCKGGIEMQEKPSQNHESIILSKLKRHFSPQKERMSSPLAKASPIFYNKKGMIRYPQIRMLSFENQHHIVN